MDIDGTLVDNGSRVTEENARAIAEAAARGIEIMLVTGRRFDFARSIAEQIPCDLHMIDSNGAVIKSRTGETHLRHLLDAGIARRVLEATRGISRQRSRYFRPPRERQVIVEHVDLDDPYRGGYFRRNLDFVSAVDPLTDCLGLDGVNAAGENGGVDRNAANYVPLTPLAFIARSAAVFPDRLAVVHGERRYSWAEAYRRCRQLASALRRRGIGKNDTVAIMAANTPEAFEAHFGVGMAGAVLNALNIRLDPAMIAFILRHGETKLLITDREFSGAIEAALTQMAQKPIVDRHRRRARAAGQAPGRDGVRALHRRPATPTSPGKRRGTSGTRSRSTTPPARRATPRASSITIAAPISTRSATRWSGACRSIRSISGPCRCFIATVGAFPGR